MAPHMTQGNSLKTLCNLGVVLSSASLSCPFELLSDETKKINLATGQSANMFKHSMNHVRSFKKTVDLIQHERMPLNRDNNFCAVKTLLPVFHCETAHQPSA